MKLFEITIHTALGFYATSFEGDTLEAAQAETVKRADTGAWVDAGTYIPPQAVRAAYLKEEPQG